MESVAADRCPSAVLKYFSRWSADKHSVALQDGAAAHGARLEAGGAVGARPEVLAGEQHRVAVPLQADAAWLGASTHVFPSEFLGP
jgi:hypothetical protein